MFRLDYGDHRPIYEQIKEKIKFLIIGGNLIPGEKIPSVRELAMEMAINPNTIQKAYKELESEGYIHSQKAKGYFVSPRSETEKEDCGELITKFTEAASELYYRGKTEEELIALIRNIYKGGNGYGHDNSN